MSTQQKWLAAIAAAVVAFFAVWGINVTYDPDPTTPPDTIVEPPDTAFQLTADPLPGRVALSWSDPPDRTTDTWVVWSATGEENSGQRLATLGPNATSTTDTDIAPSETRFYRVILVDDGDLFFFSNWVEETAEEEPSDTTDPGGSGDPVAATVNDPSPVMRVDDSITIRPNLVDDEGAIVPTDAVEWSVDFDEDFLSFSGLVATAIARTAPGSSTPVTVTHDESGHAIEVEIVILAAAEPGEWPDNEPPGLTTITHFRGDRFLDELPRWRRVGRDTAFHRYSVVDDAASKFGKALQKQYFVGDGDGWGDVGIGNNTGPRFLYGNQDRYDEVYLRLVIQFSPNWQWHLAGNHTVTSLVQGRSPQIDVLKAVPNHPVAGPKFPWGNARVGGYSWLPIIAGSPDLDTYQGSRSAIALRNEGILPRLERGRYHTIEVWLRRSDPGQTNSSMRFWLDGVEYKRFYGLGHCGDDSGCDVSFEQFRQDYPQEGNSEILTPHIELPVYWGGQNDIKNRPDWVRVSEVYESGRR